MRSWTAWMGLVLLRPLAHAFRGLSGAPCSLRMWLVVWGRQDPSPHLTFIEKEDRPPFYRTQSSFDIRSRRVPEPGPLRAPSAAAVTTPERGRETQVLLACSATIHRGEGSDVKT
jgi:hypothetical protein